MIKRIVNKYRQWNYLKKSRRPQKYKYQGLEIIIQPGVFSPKGTRTTELFAEFLLGFDWKGKSVLELGAGSGIISFLLCNKGANVTSTDINQEALKGLKQNMGTLGLEINIIHSNLFENIPQRFDIIVINPPFFNQNPKNISEEAWFCGEKFEFFSRLFYQFKNRPFNEEMLMILSEKAQIRMILETGEQQGLRIVRIAELDNIQEQHQVFKICSI